jgi:hypothetical protein
LAPQQNSVIFFLLPQREPIEISLSTLGSIICVVHKGTIVAGHVFWDDPFPMQYKSNQASGGLTPASPEIVASMDFSQEPSALCSDLLRYLTARETLPVEPNYVWHPGREHTVVFHISCLRNRSIA